MPLASLTQESLGWWDSLGQLGGSCGLTSSYNMRVNGLVSRLT